MGIPNLPADDVPDGSSDDDAELVRTWGEPPVLDFAPLDHVDLGEKLGILDLPRATKLSGPRFAVLAGKGAKLERALARSSSTSPRERLHRVLGARRSSTARR